MFCIIHALVKSPLLFDTHWLSIWLFGVGTFEISFLSAFLFVFMNGRFVTYVDLRLI